MFLTLGLFILIAASPHVNKNVSTADVTRAKPVTEPSVHKILANYQTGFGYKFKNGRYAIRFDRVEFMNALKRD